ncbi:MAG: hypothetical protein HEQ32_06020 [Vampirovibrio sp.]
MSFFDSFSTAKTNTKPSSPELMPSIELQGVFPSLPSSASFSSQEESQARVDRLSLVLNEMGRLPLWVQQVIYADLKRNLDKDAVSSPLSEIKRRDFLQLWVPILNTEGQEAFRSIASDSKEDTHLLLTSFQLNDNIAMLCARYTWSLQYACQLIVQVLRRNWIHRPESKVLEASIRFLGDEIRLGEYLVYLGLVDREQMELALQTQNYIESTMGERSKIADILIRLGLITIEDVGSILFLKEESRKPFQIF